MSFFDLLVLILDNLSRRKARVALTAIGVVIGTAAVVVLVSLAIGLQQNATSQLWGINDLSLINVNPGMGSMEPIEKPGAGGEQPGEPKWLNEDALLELAALPGVQYVFPRDNLQGQGILKVGRMETWANLVGVSDGELEKLELKVSGGTLELGRGKAVVGFNVPKNFYDPTWRPGMEQPTPPELLDQKMKLILSKWDQEGLEVRKNLQIQVVGTLVETKGEADWNIYVPIKELTGYNEWLNGRRINRKREGYPFVIVKVESADKVVEIADQINGLGYMAWTPATVVQGINSFYLVVQVIFGGVGAIALLVAAIGIANTMTMAILERTREIGLMKAVGATNRDVLSVFLGEAAGIGFIGGLGGVLLGWSAGQVINVLAMAYLAGQNAQQGLPPPTAAVITPTWLPVFALAFATIIGLISGLYPALRAATLVPVMALKYE
jgi:putative ABC transport system permease protein